MSKMWLILVLFVLPWGGASLGCRDATSTDPAVAKLAQVRDADLQHLETMTESERDASRAKLRKQLDGMSKDQRKAFFEESGAKMPEYQVWFNKQHNCINDPFGTINPPVVSNMLDYEAEMCFVIAKRCKHVPVDRAHEVIGGYFVGNDVSVRDWQLRTNTWQIGKSFDTHGPIGPWLVTPDEVGDPHALDIKCWVNGELRQNSNTKHLIFSCFDQIAHLSQAFTLDVGDVIFTGTSSGVGMAMKPPVTLKVGDVVKVEIEKLGHIENRVVPEKADTIIG